jgi:hypothetical protein
LDVDDDPPISGNTVALRPEVVPASAKKAGYVAPPVRETSDDKEMSGKRLKGRGGKTVLRSAADQKQLALQNPLNQADIVDQKQLMAPPGMSAPDPQVTTVALRTEGQKALLLVKNSFHKADAVLQAARAKMNELYEEGERKMAWNDKNSLYLEDARWAVEHNFYLYEKQITGYPQTNAIAQARDRSSPLYEAHRERSTYIKALKTSFEDLWNDSFEQLWFSQRNDGKGAHKNRKAWRSKWAELLAGDQRRPTFYFHGYLEPGPIAGQDQKLWELSRIWGSKSRLFDDTEYPPKGPVSN